MTFSTGVPDADASPGDWPAESQTNFARLKTMLAANHAFNDSSSSDDGYHELVNWNATADSAITTGALLQTFSNSPIAAVGSMLFTRLTNTGDQDGFNSTICKRGVDTPISLTASGGLTPSATIIDFNGLTYAWGIVTVFGQSSTDPTQQAQMATYQFRYNSASTNKIDAKVMAADTSLSINGGGTSLTVSNANGSIAYDVYWSIDFYGISPLS